MRNKKPWFRKAWKDHASEKPQADSEKRPETDAEIENIPSGTGNDSPDAAAQLFESEAAKQTETAGGEPNAAQKLFENEAYESQDDIPNAAQRLYAEESARDEKKAKPASRRKYVIAAAMSAAVLLLSAIPATYSYLTASSDTVINTFAGGAISIKLDEALVDTDGNPIGSTRVIENSYEITPGASYTKDPTITVLAGSEDAYLFIYVDNALPEEYFSLNYSNSWVAVATTGTKTLYVYKSVVTSSDEDITLDPIFTTVTVSAEITSEQIEALGEVQLTVQSYAVQAEGVDSAAAISMAVSFFEEEFDFSFGDVDTSIDISGVSTENSTENTTDEDTSSVESTTDNGTSDTSASDVTSEDDTSDGSTSDDSTSSGSADGSEASGTDTDSTGAGDTDADDADTDDAGSSTSSGSSDTSESNDASLTIQSTDTSQESSDVSTGSSDTAE